MPGISMSSIATSGRTSSAVGTTASPLDDLGDDVDVVLHREQRDEGAAHQRLVLGEQDPDRRLRHRGRMSWRPGLGRRRRSGRRPPAGSRPPARGPASRRPPTRSSRSRRPRSPVPPASDPTVDGRRPPCRRRRPRSRPRRRRGCVRMAAVPRGAVAHDVRDGLADGPREDGILGRRRGRRPTVDRRLDPGRLEHEPGVLELALERWLARAADRVADACQRLAGDPLDIGDLGPGSVGVPGQQPAGELALDRDERQAVAEDVMEVAGDPVALLGDGQRRELLLRGVELRVRPPQRGHREDRDPDDRRPTGPG